MPLQFPNIAEGINAVSHSMISGGGFLSSI